MHTGAFITSIVVNPLERRLEKRTSVQCAIFWLLYFGWETSTAFAFSTLFYDDCLTQ